MFEDKENQRPCVDLSSKNSNNQQNADKKLTSKSAFGRLLKDATNEIRGQEDERIAVDYQLEEAAGLAAGWLQEEKDRIIAEKLLVQLKDEEKVSSIKLIKQDEKVALGAAMEERRRIVAEAKNARETEEKDVEYARRVVIDDVEQEHQEKEACKDDCDFAEKVHQVLQDELWADELAQAETKQDQRRRQELQRLMEADEKYANEAQSQLESERMASMAKDEESSLQEAKEMQSQLDREYTSLQTIQAEKDRVLSRKLQIASLRSEHRRSKRVAFLTSGAAFQNEAAVRKQWEQAEADCEDVARGICLTIVLPHLRDLKVRVMGKRKVEIEAISCSNEPSSYCAEFLIAGRNVHVTEEDLSYEYASETGLLHVYVERVQLDGIEEDLNDQHDDKVVSILKKGMQELTRVFRSSRK